MRPLLRVVQGGAGALLSALLLFAVAAPVFSASIGTARYDDDIERASKRYLPGWDWRWYRAQLYQESRLDPAAVSPAGARGIAQFMPGTWGDIAPQLGYGAASPHAAGPAIEAGALYMARLRMVWKAERPEADRRELAQASYNAGTGHVLAAQRTCNGARHWPEISACLPQVTGRHAKETIDYVDRIRRWYTAMRV